MKKNKIKNFAIAMSLSFGMLLSGCGSEKTGTGTGTGTDAAQSAGEKKVTIGMTGDVNTWNPWLYNEIEANSIQRHVFDTLIDVDNDMKQVPALATEWTTSDNGKTWDFTLRENVKFSNGCDFTADDVIYSFQRCMELNKGWSDSTAPIESVEKVDDMHVKFICKDEEATFPASAKNIMILDKETTEALSDEELDSTVVGTGPYVLTTYVRDSSTVLTKSETYWGEKPEADVVEFKAIANDGTRTASLIGKEIDMSVNVAVTDVTTLEAQDFLNVVSVPSIGVMFYNIAQTEENPSTDAQMPLRSPDGSNPLNIKEVRLAMALAIDTQQLIDKVQNGYAVMAPTCVPEGFNGYNPDIEDYGYDPTKAEELLDAAGYPKQADGYRFEITLDCTNDRYINDQATATAVAGYLDKVGIKCNVNAMSRSVFFDYIRIHDETDNSCFIQSGWSDTSGESVLLARDLLYGITFEGRLKEGYGGANRGYYNNPEVNKLIDEALKTSDYDKRDEIMKQVWQIAHDDVALITTYFTSDIYAINKRVNYTPRADEYIYAWNFSFAE